ncbi:undecaprenyl-diphosphate phosphatase [Magnetospira sp. QH-2]|uniref:undecaprenyl-diphosphate phosphatase n=1 Tax=Magnetospira sp. (strain QH-2) TaxID=1288970 RepID=UPI0003E81BD0|nr:undecaprenyl-diphosphate phosphatase [Magnetospira sp. QH-2]CCQ75416.1 Undecaprenyl-diphosphatase [Magnetospira sp. QH-2]
MSLLQLTVIALVQGITEFLPISSSGHLILVPQLTGWEDQGLLMDVAVHVGTLLAVMLYFWRDVWAMLSGLGNLFKGRLDPGARMVLLVVVATIPVIGVGYLAKDFVSTHLRSIEVIAWATLGFGIVIYIADRLGMTMRRMEHLGFSDAVIIGLSQCLALIPGTSRSGITMAAARALGMERPDAARFSMLISMPTILGAGVLAGKDLYESGNAQLSFDALIAGGLAFASALVAIWGLMAWLKRASFTPFVIYRMLLGVGLLALAYG